MKHLLTIGLTLLLFALLAAPSQGQQADSPKAEEEYRLGPEDGIEIHVWGRGDLSGQVILDPAGRIQLPLVGQVTASGRTPGDLGRYLTERYQLLDPSIPEVLVTVLQYNSLSLKLVGEVRNPGRHGFVEMPDLWKAILAAGGATPTADLAKVQVVRKEPAKGEPRVTAFDLSKGIEKTDLEKLPHLKPGDTIIVPSLAEGVGAGNKIQILGSVRNPGPYSAGAAETLVQAISVCGGALPDADLRKVRLTRVTGEGAIAYELNLQDYLYSGSPPVDLALQPGDVVTVPSRRTGMAETLDRVVRLVPLVSVALGLVYAFQ